MLQTIKSILSGGRAAPVWQIGENELVLIINAKNRISAARGDSKALFGLGAGTMKGQSVYSLVRPDEQDRLASAINYVRRSFQGAHRVASPADNRDSANPARQHSLRLKASGSQRDITFRLQAAGVDAVRVFVTAAPAGQGLVDGGDTHDKHNDGVTPLLTANRVQRDQPGLSVGQLADLSHEMKTPLNAILGFADAIREEAFGPLGNDRYREYIDDIYCSGQHLLSLIETVLDMSRGEEAGRTERQTMTSLSCLIDEVVPMIRPQLEKARLRLRVEIEKGVPESYLNAQAVRQILINLLTNAIKFTSDGEIVVTTYRDPEDGNLILAVCDTGIGMSAEQLQKIGDRYTDVQASGVRGTAGHGLGLTLAQRLVQQCVGSLTFQSEPGEGLTATVKLPFVQEAPRQSDQTISPGQEYTGGKPKALVTQMERIDQFRKRMNSERESTAA